MKFCEHGLDVRVGVCAECDPDSEPTYKNTAPRRAPLEPTEAQLRSAGAEGVGGVALRLTFTVTDDGRVSVDSEGVFDSRGWRRPERGPIGSRATHPIGIMQKLFSEISMLGYVGPREGWWHAHPLSESRRQKWVADKLAEIVGRADDTVARELEKLEAEALRAPHKCDYCGLRYKTERGIANHLALCVVRKERQ